MTLFFAHDFIFQKIILIKIFWNKKIGKNSIIGDAAIGNYGSSD